MYARVRETPDSGSSDLDNNAKAVALDSHIPLITGTCTLYRYLAMDAPPRHWPCHGCLLSPYAGFFSAMGENRIRFQE